MAYILQAVRRKYIPKPGSTKQRPLGIPCFEDKLIHAGLVRILESIYERDFIEDSYGFRPARSCHDALKTLCLTMEHKPIAMTKEGLKIVGWNWYQIAEWLDASYFYQSKPADRKIGCCPPRHIKAELAGMIAVADECMAGGLNGTDAPAPELQVSELADGERQPERKQRLDPPLAAKVDV